MHQYIFLKKYTPKFQKESLIKYNKTLKLQNSEYGIFYMQEYISNYCK